MPKSKRATVVHLTKTSKKTKEKKGELITSVQEASNDFSYAWIFTIEHMRNVYLQEIRSQWKPSKMFLGRNSVMRVALGQSKEQEHLEGLHSLASLLEGDTGLLFTSEPHQVVVEWFDDYIRADHARKGNVATETVELPAGPVMINNVNDEPSVAPHSLEPHLRSLGLPTSLIRGVPTLSAPHKVCTINKTLDTNQAALLKVLGYQMAKFKVVLRHVWEKEQGNVISVDAVRESLGLPAAMLS